MEKIRNESPNFSLTIEFEKSTGDPGRVFKAMAGLVDSFQVIDRALIGQVSSKIEPILMLENIEAGSIRAFFANILKEIDDDSVKSGDWKKVAGNFLVKGKYVLLKYLDDKKQLDNISDIEAVEAELLNLAKETKVYEIPHFQNPDRETLMAGIYGTSKAMQCLDKNDKAFYDMGNGSKIDLNSITGISEERIEELLTKQTMKSRMEMILKVKKPDYLGKSRWELKHDKHTFFGTMADDDWVKRFQSREIDVRPGDALRGDVDIIVNYGYTGEVVSQKYEIQKVYEVIRFNNSHQENLRFGNDGDNK